MAPGINEPASWSADSLLDGPRFALPELSTPTVAGADADAESLSSETTTAPTLYASVYWVRDTAERPIDPSDPPRLDNNNDTRLGAYRFELSYSYNPCGGGWPPDVPASVTVHYKLSGTASEPTPDEPAPDHTGLSGQVLFTRNDNYGYDPKQVNYLAVDDTLAEPTESVVVTIEDRAEYDLGTYHTATTTIADNDSVTLESLTVANVQSPDETVTTSGGTVPLLMLSPGPDGSTTVNLTAAISPNTPTGYSQILYKASTAAGAVLATGTMNVAGTPVVLDPPDANTFFIDAGKDTNQNGTLDGPEVTHRVQADTKLVPEAEENPIVNRDPNVPGLTSGNVEDGTVVIYKGMEGEFTIRITNGKGDTVAEAGMDVRFSEEPATQDNAVLDWGERTPGGNTDGTGRVDVHIKGVKVGNFKLNVWVRTKDGKDLPPTEINVDVQEPPAP